MNHKYLYLLSFLPLCDHAVASEPKHAPNKEICEQLDCYPPKTSKQIKPNRLQQKASPFEQHINVYCSQPVNEQVQCIEKHCCDDKAFFLVSKFTEMLDDANKNALLHNNSKEQQPKSDLLSIIERVVGLGVKIFGWQTIAIILAVLFRKDISLLLGRLKKGKIGAAELNFEDEVSSLAENPDIPRATEDGVVSPTIIEEASAHPRGAVLSAWIKVEDAINHLINTRQLYSGIHDPRFHKMNFVRSLQQIVKAELIDEAYVPVLFELRTLRNQAAHKSDFNPSPESVLSFVKMANEFTEILRKKALEPSESV